MVQSEINLEAIINNLTKYASDNKCFVKWYDVKKVNDILSNNEIENKEKYNNSRVDLLNMEVGIPSFVYYGKNGIEFMNGRYRFFNLRDMGAQKIPFLINKSDEVIFNQLNLE